MSRFMHSSMRSEKFPLALTIEKFSLHVRRGYYECSELKGGEWSLVLLLSDGGGYDDCIEVQLKRNQYNSKDQFVELKLSIVDNLGLSRLSECLCSPFRSAKPSQYCFTGSRDTHKVLSVHRMNLLDKLRYLPNDTLTLRGEMVIYEETDTPFENEEDFKNSLKNSEADRAAEMFRNLFIYSIILLCGAYFGIVGTVYLYEFARDFIIPFVISIVVWFATICVVIIFCALLCYRFIVWAKEELEKSLRPESRKRRNSWEPNMNSRRDRQFVPIAYKGHGKNVTYILYDDSYYQPEKYGRFKQKKIYLEDNGYDYNRRNRYLCN